MLASVKLMNSGKVSGLDLTSQHILLEGAWGSGFCDPGAATLHSSRKTTCKRIQFGEVGLFFLVGIIIIQTTLATESQIKLRDTGFSSNGGTVDLCSGNTKD